MNATNRITLRHGDEGPRHDPYSFTEITIDGRNGEVTFHGGLGEWTALNGRTIAREGHEDPRAAFAKLTGLTPHQAEECFYRAKARKVERHLKQCGGHAEDMAGYPGESFTICSKCQAILDTDFNPKAIE